MDFNKTMRIAKVSDQTALGFGKGDDNPSVAVAVAVAVDARSCEGHSLIELVIVVALIGALTSIALPQLLAQRRLTRSVGITREILTELRLTRQLAMSQRQAITFQYDNVSKQISIIDHNDNPGPTTLIDGTYANTAKTKVVSVTPLADTATSSEMDYGIPVLFPAVPTGALGDGIPMTPLLANGQVNITFQPDGSVVKNNGDPAENAIFIYNSRSPEGTASAISIMGASGRVKIWRYNVGVNRYTD
jgi:Tfp pilus assembly protein FimT